MLVTLHLALLGGFFRHGDCSVIAGNRTQENNYGNWKNYKTVD
jgi:hypothetical protein